MKALNNKPRFSSFAFGELNTYDPTTHTGNFDLPQHLDDNGNPIQSGFIPIGTPFNGPGYGMQFPVPLGAQALIVFMDDHQDGTSSLPVSACLLFNDLETVPFPDGKTRGFKDAKGSMMTTTDDGPAAGDGVGAARIHGTAYVSHTTQGGHSDTMDDVNKVITRASAGGHTDVMNDVNKFIKRATSGGHYDLYDDNNRLISRVTSGGLKTLHSDVTSEISHIAPNIGLGNTVANLPAATNAAIRKTDMTAFESSIFTQRGLDYQNVITAVAMGMMASGVPSAPSAALMLSKLAALAHIAIPSGSSVVRMT